MYPKGRFHYHNAFSLVELSIVLVILGLLTGGILAGQSLIRAAELRSVVSEYNRYYSAAQAFRDKYMSLPGDFSSATRFWSRQENQTWCVTNSSATVASPGTCDGDGDSMLENASAASRSAEAFQFWNQLALAGLVEGTYSGYAGSGGIWHAVIGTNVPSSKLSNAAWGAMYISPTTGNTIIYDGTYGNTYIFGSQSTNTMLGAAIISPEEAWNIDTKLDDGKPAQGKVWAGFWSACAVADDGTTTSDDRVASYKLTNTSKDCYLLFRESL